MHVLRRKNLVKLAVPVVVLAVVLSLVLYALRQNISLFYTPTDVLAGKPAKGVLIRMGGRVVSGSVVRGDGLNVQFDLTDMHRTVRVYYNDLLPDLFREEQSLVVEGERLDDGTFKARQVLAKHDENYMPPEVKDALERGARAQQKAAL
jgi:cytochrome c-type biogenesis protein CcmE